MEYGDLGNALYHTKEQMKTFKLKENPSYIVRLARIQEAPFLDADGIETFRGVTSEEFNKIVDAIHDILKDNPSFLELP